MFYSIFIFILYFNSMQLTPPLIPFPVNRNVLVSDIKFDTTAASLSISSQLNPGLNLICNI